MLISKSVSGQVWHVLMSDHTDLPATHTFIHEWNEPSCSGIRLAGLVIKQSGPESDDYYVWLTCRKKSTNTVHLTDDSDQLRIHPGSMA